MSQENDESREFSHIKKVVGYLSKMKHKRLILVPFLFDIIERYLAVPDAKKDKVDAFVVKLINKTMINIDKHTSDAEIDIDQVFAEVNELHNLVSFICTGFHINMLCLRLLLKTLKIVVVNVTNIELTMIVEEFKAIFSEDESQISSLMVMACDFVIKEFFYKNIVSTAISHIDKCTEFIGNVCKHIEQMYIYQLTPDAMRAIMQEEMFVVDIHKIGATATFVSTMKIGASLDAREESQSSSSSSSSIYDNDHNFSRDYNFDEDLKFFF